MKHNLSITTYLILLFLISQIIGLFVVNQYMDYSETKASGNVTYSDLPLNLERPPVEEKNNSWIYIMAAVIIGTLLIFILIKFKKPQVWKYWFLFAVFFCLLFAFYPFLKKIPYGEYIAVMIALSLALYKVFKRNIIIHNITEVLMYGGLAAIFVPVMNLFSVSILLFIISLYDMFAVWQSKHMVKLAKFQTESKLFAGLMIPYQNKDQKNLIKKENSLIKTEKLSAMSVKDEKKEKTITRESQRNAVLGGGDIGFPLIFTGVILSDLILSYSAAISIILSLIITITTTVSLSLLLIFAKKDKFYPAMPFISIGCFIGLGLIKLTTLII